MKRYQKFLPLPLGAIKAEGFLRDQMLIGKDGMAGHLYELEPEMIYYPYIDEDDDIYDDYNAQNTTAMRGLLAFYEATGRKDVLEAVHDCMLWFTEKWAGDKKTVYSGQTLIEGMILTYWHTGDTRLVDFAEEYLEYICTRDLCKMSYKSMLENDHQYLATHTVAVAHHLVNPALVYSVTGEKSFSVQR